MVQAFQVLLRRRSLHFILLASLCVAIILRLSHDAESSVRNQIHAAIPVSFLASESSDPETRYVHLVVPANHADPNLCKTLATSMVLGYPMATIVNWQVTFQVEGQAAGGSHLGKLFGINEWLGNAEGLNNNDLVIVTDAYDVWFQLRPEVLLTRYFNINRRANERLRSELGQAHVERYGIENSIVFSAQKKCGFQKYSYPHCDIFPQSTLPDDVFGDMTDVRLPEHVNPEIYMRPRTPCSGTFVGRLGPLRRLFAKATQIAEEDPNSGSDQRTLTYIFDEQEAWRASLRSNHPTSLPHAVNDTGDWEFGIGIDYESLIGKPTVFSEFDLAFVSYENSTHIQEESTQLGIVPPRLPNQLAVDIQRSRLPFAGVRTGNEELPVKEWSQVDLFTDMWSGFTPVMIHHNAWRNNSKSRRKSWWHKPWYHPYLRPLLDAASRARNESLLAITTDEKGKEIAFHRTTSLVHGLSPASLGAISGQGEVLSWADLCDEYDDEVFRDDLGHWVDPVPA